VVDLPYAAPFIRPIRPSVRPSVGPASCPRCSGLRVRLVRSSVCLRRFGESPKTLTVKQREDNLLFCLPSDIGALTTPPPSTVYWPWGSFVMPSPVKTILELFRHAFGVLPKMATQNLQTEAKLVENGLRPPNLGLATARRRALDRSTWRQLIEVVTSTQHAPETERLIPLIFACETLISRSLVFLNAFYCTTKQTPLNGVREQAPSPDPIKSVPRAPRSFPNSALKVDKPPQFFSKSAPMQSDSVTLRVIFGYFCSPE